MASVNRDLANFLKHARNAVDPTRAGLPADGRIRRVPGLRREEVAMLAGVSTDYYVRLEQGRRITPSVSVLEAISRALDLDETARMHLGHLVGTPLLPKTSLMTAQRIRPGIHQLLSSLEKTPAMVIGRRTDVLATNRLARVLLADFDDMRPSDRNIARWSFLTAQARELLIDWESHSRSVVARLRLELGRTPNDPITRALVEELAAASEHFRAWWAEHGLYQYTHGSRHLRHPVGGEMIVDFEAFKMPGDKDQTLITFTTAAGTTSRSAMDLLTGWSLSASAPESDRVES